MSWPPAASAMSTRSEKRFLSDTDSARAPLNVAETCPKIPVLLPTWKTCGKAGCKCGRGELHGPYWSLRWREGRVHRRRYVRAADVPAVRAMIETRRDERRRERLDHALGLTTWRELARQLEDIEARIREERANR
jgi:hypothetical protein